MTQMETPAPASHLSPVTRFPTPQSNQSPRGKKRTSFSLGTPPSHTHGASPKRRNSRATETSLIADGKRSNGSSPRNNHDEGEDSILGTSELRHSLDIDEVMAEERRKFPGSQKWADDEAALFRILFLREHRALMPGEWAMDFRGIPVPETLFAQTELYHPVIYSRAGNDFKATRALIRLIELTSTVRDLAQMGHKDKFASVICKELEEYAKWAAQDGGFDDLEIVPNLVIRAVDIAEGSDRIEEYMRSSMKDLAAKHREYWRIERLAEEEAWKIPSVAYPEVKLEDGDTFQLGRDYGGSDNILSRGRPRDVPTQTSQLRNIDIKAENVPSGEAETRYTQRPPVLYGIFVIHHSAVVLTIDAAKEGDDAYVSYQVEAGFNVKYQGVWNAITIAIVICLARDHMVTMANDFVQLVDSPESDPDA